MNGAHSHFVYKGMLCMTASFKAYSSFTLDAFDAFSPSARREYIDWITEAKSEATRSRRPKQAIERMADRKPRHWKYQK